MKIFKRLMWVMFALVVIAVIGYFIYTGAHV